MKAKFTADLRGSPQIKKQGDKQSENHAERDKRG
jgi:hypothetical protein